MVIIQLKIKDDEDIYSFLRILDDNGYTPTISSANYYFGHDNKYLISFEVSDEGVING